MIEREINTMGVSFLHEHVNMQKELNFSDEHVIVDREDWEKVVKYFREGQKKTPSEQNLRTETFVKLDFLDRLKVLFGRIIKVNVSVWIPTEVDLYNASSNVKIISKSKSDFKKDLPDYGYSPVFNESNKE